MKHKKTDLRPEWDRMKDEITFWFLVGVTIALILWSIVALVPLPI